MSDQHQCWACDGLYPTFAQLVIHRCEPITPATGDAEAVVPDVSALPVAGVAVRDAEATTD